MKILQLQNITFAYNSKKVLENISFNIQENDFLGIIGPNGAGKTTLFKIITGILKPWSGSAFLYDKDIHNFSRIQFARNVSTMPQFLDTSFSFTVQDFVLMGRFPYRNKWMPPTKYDMETVDRVLNLTDTYELKNRMLYQLSGGERQRVILAQALAQEPKMLLLDEPTTHLDIGHQIEILYLIRKLNLENNLTVITILHDLNLASEYCNTLIMMDKGSIFCSGKPNEVLTYQNIEKVYKTTVLVKQNPVSLKPYIIPYKNVSESRINGMNGKPVKIRCSPATVMD